MVQILSSCLLFSSPVNLLLFFFGISLFSVSFIFILVLTLSLLYPIFVDSHYFFYPFFVGLNPLSVCSYSSILLYLEILFPYNFLFLSALTHFRFAFTVSIGYTFIIFSLVFLFFFFTLCGLKTPSRVLRPLLILGVFSQP